MYINYFICVILKFAILRTTFSFFLLCLIMLCARVCVCCMRGTPKLLKNVLWKGSFLLSVFLSFFHQSRRQNVCLKFVVLQHWKQLQTTKCRGARAAVLAQLVEQLLTTPKTRSSNPDIGKLNLLSTVLNLCWKDENKKRPGTADLNI